jgi:hypothetical protein
MMMLSILIFLSTFFLSFYVIGKATAAGFLNSAFSRGVAGITTQLGSSFYLIGYTNFVSFLNASLEGKIGIPGYLFVGAYAFLIITLGQNFIKTREFIQ